MISPLNGEPNAFWLIIFIAFAMTGSLVVYLIHKKMVLTPTNNTKEYLCLNLIWPN